MTDSIQFIDVNLENFEMPTDWGLPDHAIRSVARYNYEVSIKNAIREEYKRVRDTTKGNSSWTCHYLRKDDILYLRIRFKNLDRIALLVKMQYG